MKNILHPDQALTMKSFHNYINEIQILHPFGNDLYNPIYNFTQKTTLSVYGNIE